jgi:hypothetical protein
MVAESEGHGRSARLIALCLRRERQAQGAMGTVDGAGTTSPKVARISMESSLPCSSRCLIVWVRRTSAGTSSAGRPRWPERSG